jgi:hypothetical protein
VPVEGRTSVGRSAICRSISGLLPVTVPVLWRNGVLAAAQRLRGMGPGTCPTGIALRSGSRRVGEEPKNPLRRTGREGDSPKPIDGLQLLERTRTSTRPSRCAHRSVESLQLARCIANVPVSIRSADTPAWMSASRTVLIRRWLSPALYWLVPRRRSVEPSIPRPPRGSAAHRLRSRRVGSARRTECQSGRSRT